jgi:antitoxin (DNA-binding transcriptional repressor) of toxin-antitoxin stability system
MQVNMNEAKSQLSKLGRMAWEGEEVIIAKAGKPFLKLVPYEAEESEKKEPRKLGVWKGKIRVAPDFDETPQELIDAFYGEGEWAGEDFF